MYKPKQPSQFRVPNTAPKSSKHTYAPDTFTVPPKQLDKSAIQPEPRKYSSDAVDRIAAKITGGTVQTSEQEGVDELGFAQRMVQPEAFAVGALPIQAKLTVGIPGDEQSLPKSEADLIQKKGTSPPKITSQTVKAAPDGAPNTRTKIGVGEEVSFTGSSSGNWSMSGGIPISATNGTNLLWKAPATAGSATITLKAGSSKAKTTMNVISPTSLSMTKVRDQSFAAGTAGAGMDLNVTMNPLNVCLGTTQLLEVSGPATNITGYFTQLPAVILNHKANPIYANLNDNNTVCCDNASGSGFASPYSKGTFQWDIPNKYKLDGEPNSSGRIFTTTTQLFMMDKSGKLTITKAGASVSRSP